MNRYGSYRALLGNAVSAACAGIEIYNKPKFDYRDETAIILLVNAWELALKAVLSKNRVPIYYPKKRGQPYRTLSARDALTKAEPFFPKDVDYLATAENVQLLIEYRDTAVHFYHKDGLEVVLYSLAQTAIVNLKDLVEHVFDRDLAEEVSISLLPLSFATPVDPIQFLRRARTDVGFNSAVRDFANLVTSAVESLESENRDTGRLLTVFQVKLISTKKVEKADLVVGVQSEAGANGKLLVQKPTDPNASHPYRESDIITPKSGDRGLGIEYSGLLLGQYQFRAIGRQLKVREKPEWCWRDSTGMVTRYSEKYVNRLKSLSRADVENAMADYNKRT